jgi:hypothetical protein
VHQLVNKRTWMTPRCTVQLKIKVQNFTGTFLYNKRLYLLWRYLFSKRCSSMSLQKARYPCVSTTLMPTGMREWVNYRKYIHTHDWLVLKFSKTEHKNAFDCLSICKILIIIIIFINCNWVVTRWQWLFSHPFSKKHNLSSHKILGHI